MSLATNELPMLAILYREWETGDFSRISRSNAWFLASRESFELRQETEQMGWSLAQLALSLQWHDESRQITLRSLKPICLPTAFAYAAGALRIDLESCLAAYCFSWIENQVAAALKAVPLGQIAGQKILFAMHAHHPRNSASGRSAPAPSRSPRSLPISEFFRPGMQTSIRACFALEGASQKRNKPPISRKFVDPERFAAGLGY